MRTVQWQTKEHFIFPSTTGTPKNVETVNVTPRFTIDRSADNLRMTGIYHLAANVEFDTEVNTGEALDSAIMIDDVDIEGELGYFEYAVPFNIDLPPEAADPLNMVTLNTTHEVDEHGQLAIIWDVECTYKEDIVIPDQTLAEEAEREAKNAEVHIGNTEQTEKKSESEQTSKVVGEQAKPEQTSKVVEEQTKQEQSSKVVVENTAFSDGDEVLSFISELDDDISATLFLLNDVLVQSES